MNLDQSTRAIPVICTCKNVIWMFLTRPHEMPTLIFFALFHHDRGWENESISDRIGGYIFCTCGVKGHHIKKIHIKKIIFL